MKKTILFFISLFVVMPMISACNFELIPDPNAECKHNYISSMTEPPTEVSEGETMYICNKCGDIRKEAIPKVVKHVISNAVLNDAISNCRYYWNNFSITVGKLVNARMDSYEVNYISGEEALSKGYISENNIDESVSIDNVYYGVISGYAMVNPNLPHYTEYEEKAVEVLMIFDDNDKLISSEVRLCRNLQTCAAIMMTSSY